MLYDSRTSKPPRRPTPLRFPLLSKHERARDPSLSFFVFASSPSHGLRNPNPRGGGKRKQERENSLARPLRRAMGRRKERRLAAKAAAGGRRVKLDLFLDPSPGGTPSKEGERGENHDQQTGVPTSPSSSGGFHQFPSKGFVKKTCLWNLNLVEIWNFCTSIYMLHIYG
jgi:hypothetical protein